MKHLAYVLILVLAFSCKDNQKEKVDTKVESTTQNTEKDTETTADLPFLKDIKSLEKDTSANPIEAFKTKATNLCLRVSLINLNTAKFFFSILYFLI